MCFYKLQNRMLKNRVIFLSLLVSTQSLPILIQFCLMETKQNIWVYYHPIIVSATLTQGEISQNLLN